MSKVTELCARWERKAATLRAKGDIHAAALYESFGDPLAEAIAEDARDQLPGAGEREPEGTT